MYVVWYRNTMLEDGPLGVFSTPQKALEWAARWLTNEIGHEVPATWDQWQDVDKTLWRRAYCVNGTDGNLRYSLEIIPTNTLDPEPDELKAPKGRHAHHQPLAEWERELLGVGLKPLYEHDCELCTYLGSKDGVDMYVCEEDEYDDPGRRTVLIRRSNHISDYVAGIIHDQSFPLLRTAADLAFRSNLLYREDEEV